MKSLIEEIDRLKVIRATIFTLLIINFSGCKNTGGISIMPNRGANEVHPLNMDFADSIDSLNVSTLYVFLIYSSIIPTLFLIYYSSLYYLC